MSRPRAAHQGIAVEPPAKLSAVLGGGMGHRDAPRKPVRAVEAVAALGHPDHRPSARNAKFTLANLAHNFTGLAWLQRRATPA